MAQLPKKQLCKRLSQINGPGTQAPSLGDVGWRTETSATLGSSIQPGICKSVNCSTYWPAKITDRLEYYCWWFRNPVNSPVEGKVVYPIIYRVLAPSQVVVWDFWTIKGMGPFHLIQWVDSFILVAKFLAFWFQKTTPRFQKCSGRTFCFLLLVVWLLGNP